MNLQEFQNTIDNLILIYREREALTQEVTRLRQALLEMEMIAGNKLERLEAENARLRNVLSIYANPTYWQATQGDDQEYIFCESAGMKIYAQGKAARAALDGGE